MQRPADQSDNLNAIIDDVAQLAVDGHWEDFADGMHLLAQKWKAAGLSKLGFLGFCQRVEDTVIDRAEYQLGVREKIKLALRKRVHGSEIFVTVKKKGASYGKKE